MAESRQRFDMSKKSPLPQRPGPPQDLLGSLQEGFERARGRLPRADDVFGGNLEGLLRDIFEGKHKSPDESVPQPWPNINDQFPVSPAWREFPKEGFSNRTFDWKSSPNTSLQPPARPIGYPEAARPMSDPGSGDALSKLLEMLSKGEGI